MDSLSEGVCTPVPVVRGRPFARRQPNRVVPAVHREPHCTEASTDTRFGFIFQPGPPDGPMRLRRWAHFVLPAGRSCRTTSC